MAPTTTNDAQREFDARYITSSEIMDKLGVTRTTILFARRTGKLPDPILIKGQIFLWERATINAYLDAWKLILETRRGVGA